MVLSSLRPNRPNQSRPKSWRSSPSACPERSLRARREPRRSEKEVEQRSIPRFGLSRVGPRTVCRMISSRFMLKSSQTRWRCFGNKPEICCQPSHVGVSRCIREDSEHLGCHFLAFIFLKKFPPTSDPYRFALPKHRCASSGDFLSANWVLQDFFSWRSAHFLKANQSICQKLPLFPARLVFIGQSFWRQYIYIYYI